MALVIIFFLTCWYKGDVVAVYLATFLSIATQRARYPFYDQVKEMILVRFKMINKHTNTSPTQMFILYFFLNLAPNQVLESSKNWWKLRNYKGQVGFAPYTILKPMRTEVRETHPNMFFQMLLPLMSKNTFLQQESKTNLIWFY